MSTDRVSERKIAESNWNAYRRACDAGHDDYITHAIRCDKFYLGEQWDEKVLKKL